MNYKLDELWRQIAQLQKNLKQKEIESKKFAENQKKDAEVAKLNQQK